jgi:hypothetical protein
MPRRNAGPLQFTDEPRSIVLDDRNEESAGSLRIEEESFEIIAEQAFVADQTFGEVAIILEPARNITGANAF